MSTAPRLERELPVILGDLAGGPYPDYIDDVLVTTAQRRQRPAWTFPERWLPVDIVTTQVGAPRAPWRQIGVLALIALLIAGLVAVYIGSQPRLPAPFGVAGNGSIVFVDDGDIYVSDTLTGTPRLLIDDRQVDREVAVSRDGRRISYLQDVPKGSDLYVASIDGTHVTKVNTDPLLEVGHPSWSPDGSTIAVDHEVGTVPVISLMATDGSGTRRLETGMPSWDIDWRPPDGKTLLFRGEQDGIVDVYLINVDGSGLQPLHIPTKTTSGGETLIRPVWSPDGTRIAYHSSDLISLTPEIVGSWRSHVFDLATRKDIVLSPKDKPDQHDTEPIWSPDGKSILTQRFIFGVAAWMAVIPADGSGPGVDLDLRSTEYPPSGWRGQFSPDGTKVVAYYDYIDRAVWFDPATGKSTDLDWALSAAPTYQRVAP